jgi:hypothetical protein
MVATNGRLNQQMTRVSYFNKIYLLVIFSNLVINLKFIMALCLINSHTTKDIVCNLQCLGSIMAEICVQNQTEKLVFIQE